MREKFVKSNHFVLRYILLCLLNQPRLHNLAKSKQKEAAVSLQQQLRTRARNEKLEIKVKNQKEKKEDLLEISIHNA